MRLPTQVSNVAHKTILELDTWVVGTEVERDMELKVSTTSASPNPNP